MKFLLLIFIFFINCGLIYPQNTITINGKIEMLSPARKIVLSAGGGNFKAQFRRADRSGAALAIIIGEDELARGVVALKPLRQETGQSECAIAELPSRVEAALRGAVGGSGRG